MEDHATITQEDMVASAMAGTQESDAKKVYILKVIKYRIISLLFNTVMLNHSIIYICKCLFIYTFTDWKRHPLIN